LKTGKGRELGEEEGEKEEEKGTPLTEGFIAGSWRKKGILRNKKKASNPSRLCTSLSSHTGK
jgi:hypothetical protein